MLANKNIDKEVLAYCAGVIDSDGSIRVDRVNLSNYRNSGKPYLMFREFVQVGQVETEAVDLLKATFGGSISIRRQPPHRDLYVWRIISRMAHQAVVSLKPYIRIKSAQAENMLKLRHVMEASKAANRTLPGKVGTQQRAKEFTAAMTYHYVVGRKLNGSVLTESQQELLINPPTTKFEILPPRRRIERTTENKGRVLSSDEVTEAKSLYERGGVSYEELGNRFGVSTSHVWTKINGRGCKGKANG